MLSAVGLAIALLHLQACCHVETSAFLVCKFAATAQLGDDILERQSELLLLFTTLDKPHMSEFRVITRIA